jgi:23S rRNA pseudouridine2605 synthase
MKERLQKIIANSGLCSRRKAEDIIKAGKVLVNGYVAEIGDKADIEKERITVNGRLLSYERKRYFMFNKPRGYTTTLKDPYEKKIITRLIRVKERVYPVGRLDKDSEGLLILTNDGEFANRIMHPKYQINKTYYIKANRPISNEHAKEIERGIVIEGIKTYRARVKRISDRELEITIHEGRNRIVRKMLEAMGYAIERLVRLAIGQLEMKDLQSGNYRELSQKEITLIFKK